ncbi:hypothetical protein WJX72_010932 [[Myrmecia] bisecta]|uniref:Uncharacterized protein n=1 Tax=[Myrmecia] bisecta TaxID=41462 RepID=A0AAW1PPV4_9CHLO
MPYEDVFDRIAVQAWSEAKVQAWKVRTTSPNDYLNRFPAPGERQAVGAFEGNEAQAFKQRLTNFQSKGWPLSPCWGIFSLVLPNRTGQQCAAHYRKTSSSNANAGSGQQQSSKAATAAAAAACICHHHRQLQALWAAPAAQRLASRVDAWLNAAGLLAAPKSQAKASAQPRSSSGSTALGNTPASHTGQKSSNALRQRATVNPADALEDKGDMEFGHQVTSIKILHLRQLPGLAPRNVQPYAPPPTPTSLGASSQAASQTRSVQYTDSLLAFDLARAGSNFLGVLMNPPVVSTSGNGSVGITSTQLAAMQLGSLKLVASGLLCVWAAKDCLAEVARCMSMWGFKYVENLTWLQLSPNNHPLRLPSPAVAASHLTLLIGRKGNSDLELRHQRCPDVVIAPVPAHGLVPEAVYETIETMLPDATPALKDPDNHAPRLLELRWGGAEASARNGWSTVVQKAASCTGDPCS